MTLFGSRSARLPLRSFLLAMGAVASFAACSRTTLDQLDDTGVGGSGGGTSHSSTSSAHSTSTSTSTSSSTSSSSSTMSQCMVALDCDDGDPCTTDACVGGFCQHTPRDDDGDGHAPIFCGGDDCNDGNPNQFPGHPEICNDGVDNDCNKVADCFDPACAGQKDCGCNPNPGGEICDNGKDDDCDGLVDCADPTCIGTPACGCSASEAGKCGNGIDDDCDGLIDCEDPACATDPICACMSTFEDCTNGVDDNCNGLVDCKDPQCAQTAFCVCTPGAAEQCDNGKDDDCDGLIDCQDPNCIGSPACKQCKPEICDDGIDNDCNFLVDCADPACAFAPNCAATHEICNNGTDDNNDGLIDCEDPECAQNPLCVLKHQNCQTALQIINSGSATYTGDTAGHPNDTSGSCGGGAGEAVFYFTLSQPTKVHLDSKGTSFDSVLYVRTGSCKSGKEIGCDDDTGGNHAALLDFTLLYPGTYYVFLDGYTVDPNQGANEGAYVLNVDFTPNPPEICDNGIDDDGDQYVDCADPNCKTTAACFKCNGGQDPGPEFGPAACTDGKDNDCDGKVDCADPDCHASDYYVTECCNGADDNGNGIIDEFACRCASDADCPGGQVCYTHTVHSCSIPCDAFFGDVCPFVAPGSTCNPSTHQCEF